jgi:hypothetical protein
MDLKTHKGAIALDGVVAHITRENDSVKRIELAGMHEGKPTLYVLAMCNYGSGINVLTQAPPKMVKRFRLSGEIAGVAISKDFETRTEASEAHDAFRYADGLSIAEVEIPEVAGE